MKVRREPDKPSSTPSVLSSDLESLPPLVVTCRPFPSNGWIWCHRYFRFEADRNVTVVRSESVRNIIRERRMLEHVNHPFICNLRYSFQDIEYMYDPHERVLRFGDGGGLHITQQVSRGRFDERW